MASAPPTTPTTRPAPPNVTRPAFVVPALIAAFLALAALGMIPISYIALMTNAPAGMETLHPVLGAVGAVWLGGWTALAIFNPASKPWRDRTPRADGALVVSAVAALVIGAFAITLRPYAAPYALSAADVALALLAPALITHVLIATFVAAPIVRQCARGEQQLIGIYLTRGASIIGLIASILVGAQWIYFEATHDALISWSESLGAAVFVVPMLLFLGAIFLLALAGIVTFQLCLSLRSAHRCFAEHRAHAENPGAAS